MPTEIWLTIALILGFIVAAGAIMAVLAWVGIGVFRRMERRRPSSEGREQSVAVANGLFELGEVREDGGPDPADRVDENAARDYEENP
ncbi:hypothetical protein [Cumulibacter soli]|uniref:hypothetical protein n=1 Tax=Cumulibacter soli TaxID=2546344 RepID=UPI001068A90D|nr:hypothetical protein [Cumulibacter soli]